MNPKALILKYLKSVSLGVRLFFIGLIPIISLSYFAYLLYAEKNIKIEFIRENLNRVEETASVHNLLTQLAVERRSSIDFVEIRSDSVEFVLKKQRLKTDSLIDELRSNMRFPHNYQKYAFLAGIDTIRQKVAEINMAHLSEMLNTYMVLTYQLNSVVPASPSTTLFSSEAFVDFNSQKLLNDILVYLSMLRTQVYSYIANDRLPLKPNLEFSGLYNNYERTSNEFLSYSTSKDSAKYREILGKRLFLPFHIVLENIHMEGELPAGISARDWYAQTTLPLLELRALQEDIRGRLFQKMNDILQNEIRKKNQFSFFLLLSISVIILIVFMIGRRLVRVLRELSSDASEISKGVTTIPDRTYPTGIVKELALSIHRIRDSNLDLSRAADEIGKGNFNILLTPRSEDDLLVLSIKKMKRRLKEFTEQKESLTTEAMRLLNQKEDFFNITSHELKTPITSLKAYNQLLILDSGDLDQDKIYMLTQMEQQIDKLITLINDLLDTSKLQEGRLTFQMEDVRLNELVATQIQALHLKNPGFKIVFQKNMNGKVWGDRERLGQVIRSLLNNAIKYSNTRREAIVRLERTKKSILFSVKDFGMGMAANELDKVFARFYRITIDRMYTYPGLGLGLFISNEIIQYHGGKLWAQSVQGEGSTFFFELPLIESSD